MPKVRGRRMTARDRAQAAVNRAGYNSRSKFMKRTTKRGAYRRPQKKAMMNRRAPFVETKSKTREDLVVQFSGLTDVSGFRTSNTPHIHMNPDTFLMWKRGMEETEVIGNSCYAKYLKMKVGIRFPQPAFSSGGYTKIIPNTPQNYELIWGWVPNELGYTGSTTPAADQATIQNINAFINERVVDYVDSQKDRMRFVPKRASTIRITGRRKIRPDMRFLSTAPPTTVDSTMGTDYAVGTIPDKYTSISWRMGKKLHLQPSSKLEGANEGLYPNFGTWLPFATLVIWDYDTLPGAPSAATQAYLPAVQYNDCIWYSDS